MGAAHQARFTALLDGSLDLQMASAIENKVPSNEAMYKANVLHTGLLSYFWLTIHGLSDVEAAAEVEYLEKCDLQGLMTIASTAMQPC